MKGKDVQAACTIPAAYCPSSTVSRIFEKSQECQPSAERCAANITASNSEEDIALCQDRGLRRGVPRPLPLCSVT